MYFVVAYIYLIKSKAFLWINFFHVLHIQIFEVHPNFFSFFEFIYDLGHVDEVNSIRINYFFGCVVVL